MELTPKQFEILLCEFCKQDLPPNFKVEHDKKNLGNESKIKRQIDVKIKGRLGVSNILICAEAKNWKKAVGGITIDGLVGKYLSGEIQANKVILFSNKGYALPAITRGKKLGIELLEPEELGKPIKDIPHIIGVGIIDQMLITTTYLGHQENLMTVNINDYIILKGDERITFQQNVFRLLKTKFREINNKNIYSDLTKITINDYNVLYELKEKKGSRYNANFKVEVTLIWDYFYENLSTGILRHINSGEIKYINLNGNPAEVLRKVLMSNTKINYEKREECIQEVVQKNISHKLLLCIKDPDREKSHPDEPILSFI